MPSKRSTKKRTKRMPAGARKRRGGFPCAECGFVAKHAMGLGRHRSTRHGVVSQRQQRRSSAGAWITREQAASRAGVHYNTIRQWERNGLVRRDKRPGVRGALISLDDLNRVLAGRSSPSGSGTDGAAVAGLEQRFSQLIEGLEGLVASLKTGRAPRKTTAAKRKTAKRKTAKRKTAKRKTAKRKPAKRKTAKRKTAKRKTAKRKTAKRR